MFEGFDRSAIDFLWGIRLNNDKTGTKVIKMNTSKISQSP